MLERLLRANLNHLVVLAVLLEEANVTRAARRLGLSQSATSHALASLRREFDDELLVRGRRGMTLTEHALRIKPGLRAALAELVTVTEDRADFDPKATRRTFTLATADFLLAPLGRELAHLFAKKAPDCTLRLEQLRIQEVAEALGARSLDVVVAPMLPFEAGVSSELAHEETFVTGVSLDHPVCAQLPHARSLTLETFTSLKHALISPTQRGTSAVDVELTARGLNRQVVVRFDSFAAAGSGLVGSRWILTAPRSVFRDVRRKVRLFEPPLPLRPLQLGLHVDASRKASPEVAWFRKQVLTALRHL